GPVGPSRQAGRRQPGGRLVAARGGLRLAGQEHRVRPTRPEHPGDPEQGQVAGDGGIGVTKLKYFGDDPLPRELAQEIHALEQDGKTRGQVVKELGVSYTALRRHLGVRNNEESRARAMEKYDPYIDEIAVEKALRGERRAWDRLTYYERQEVRAALLRRSEREPYSQDHRSGVEAYW